MGLSTRIGVRVEPLTRRAREAREKKKHEKMRCARVVIIHRINNTHRLTRYRCRPVGRLDQYTYGQNRHRTMAQYASQSFPYFSWHAS